MSYEIFVALLIYSFATSITPGPNNLMLLASGVNFGFVRSIPHALGISVGFFVLLVAIGLGLGAVLTAFPGLHLTLKVAGGAYLLYLAWRIASSRSVGQDGRSTGRPMTFLQAAAFQWVNPKAWIMGIGAMTVYTNAEAPFLSVVLVSTVFALVNLPSVSMWAEFGVALRQRLSDPNRLKWFNVTMGSLLALSLWPLLI